MNLIPLVLQVEYFLLQNIIHTCIIEKYIICSVKKLNQFLPRVCHVLTGADLQLLQIMILRVAVYKSLVAAPMGTGLTGCLLIFS